jgi:predicted permease
MLAGYCRTMPSLAVLDSIAPIATITTPFFGLVLCGWLAARAGVLPVSAIPGLNAFTLFFALPALLFRLGASGALAHGLSGTAVLVYALAGLALFALVWRLERTARASPLNAAFAALTTTFPNSGFMGLPLLMSLLGPMAAGPIAGTLLVDVFITSSLCLALAHAAEHTGHPLQAARDALRPVLGNPLPWSIAAGALAGGLGVAPSGALDHGLKMLADAASPVALFTLGAMLERTRQQPAPAQAPRPVTTLALLKLVAHPALVAGLGVLAPALGLALPRPAWLALVLTAALPSAGNVSLLAERHGADTGRLARLIVVTTAASFVSFIAIATLSQGLTHGGGTP